MEKMIPLGSCHIYRHLEHSSCLTQCVPFQVHQSPSPSVAPHPLSVCFHSGGQL